MNLRSRIGALRRRVWSGFYRREIPLGQHGPFITFTFDDFPRSAFLVGAPLVERFGGHATFYASLGRIGTKNNLGEQFHKADLQSLVARGHEVASHTFRHSSAHKMGYREFEHDVRRGLEALRDQLGGQASSNFAYPYGEVTLTAKRGLARQLDSCRTTCPGLNGPSVDLNFLYANSLYGGIEKVEFARRLIQQNEASKTWLIFYTHDVSDDPSPYGCTPELLEEALSYATAHGSRLLSIAEVLSEFRSDDSIGRGDRRILEQGCGVRS